MKSQHIYIETVLYTTHPGLNKSVRKSTSLQHYFTARTK